MDDLRFLSFVGILPNLSFEQTNRLSILLKQQQHKIKTRNIILSLKKYNTGRIIDEPFKDISPHHDVIDNIIDFKIARESSDNVAELAIRFLMTNSKGNKRIMAVYIRNIPRTTLILIAKKDNTIDLFNPDGSICESGWIGVCNSNIGYGGLSYYQSWNKDEDAEEARDIKTMCTKIHEFSTYLIEHHIVGDIIRYLEEHISSYLWIHDYLNEDNDSIKDN